MSDMSIDDHGVAASLARTAVASLVALRAEGILEGRALGDAGDEVSHHVLTRLLARLRPDDAVLSEEAVADRDARAERTWIIDPLDGTREYAEGRHDWAVHVALVVAGEPVAAAVGGSDHTVLSSASPPRLVERPERTLHVAVSRSRPPQEAELLVSRLGAELVPMGSAGHKAMAVVRGEVDAYVHAGGQYQWDSAAPVGVALSAGLHCSRIDGSPLVYGGADPSLPDLLICRPESARDLLQALAS
jgi:3'(2'), 5'-bisphosphate nucleotidase